MPTRPKKRRIEKPDASSTNGAHLRNSMSLCRNKLKKGDMAVDIPVASTSFSSSASANLKDAEFRSYVTCMVVKKCFTIHKSMILPQRALGDEGMIKHSILYPEVSLQIRLRSEHFRL